MDYSINYWEMFKSIFTMLFSLWPVWVMLIIVALMKITSEVWLPRYIKNRLTKKKIAQVNNWSSESDMSVKKENEDSSHKETEVCPTCGGKLMVKNGKFGKFLGCSNYPKCRFTKKTVI